MMFYLFFTPLTQHLKVGKANSFKNLLSRLQERRRQCGKTIILGLKFCEKPEAEESVWKKYLNNFAISQECFDLSCCDSDLKWLENFIIEREIIENVEREIYKSSIGFGHPRKQIDLEVWVKDAMNWEWDGVDEYPEFSDLFEVVPFSQYL
jgi:hypothetical protein